MSEPNIHIATNLEREPQATTSVLYDEELAVGQTEKNSVLQEGDIETATGELRQDIEEGEAAQQEVITVETSAMFVDPAFYQLMREYRERNNSTGGQSDQALTTSTVSVRSEALDDSEAVRLFETQGYVRQAPNFREQVADEARTDTFYSHRGKWSKAKLVGPFTEHQGLVQLHDTLSKFVEHFSRQTRALKRETREGLAQAKSMLEGLTFIGGPEFREATHGIGEYWKHYLDGSPERTLCVLTEVGNLERYANHHRQKKSDEYLRDQILQTFSEADRENYAGRIVFSVGEIISRPSNTRVVLLDDWTISGTQMRDTYDRLSSDPRAKELIEAGCVEVNLLAASRDRIKNGLELNPYDKSKGSVPVRAYFRAHRATKAVASGEAHITGLHCSVNYGFSNPCRTIQKALRDYVPGFEIALARIKQPYKAEFGDSTIGSAKIPSDVALAGKVVM